MAGAAEGQRAGGQATLVLRYELEEDDVARADRRAARDHVLKALPVMLGGMLLAIAVLDLAAGRAVFILFRTLPWVGLALVVGVTGLSLGGLYLHLGRISKRNQAARAWMFGAVELEAGPWGLRVNNPAGRQELSWGTIHRVRETPDAILLYVDTSNRMVLPKPSFTSKEAEDRFRSLLDRNVGG